MKVISCDLTSLNKDIIHPKSGTKYQEFQLKIENLDESAYSLLHKSETNEECVNHLFQIARMEDRTLHLIMAILYGKDTEWWKQCSSYDDYNAKECIQIAFPIRDLEEEIRSNLVFKTLLPGISSIPTDEILDKLKPLFDYVDTNKSNLADVYDKDLDNLTGMSTKKKILILLNEANEYTGHIYHYYSRENEDIFIGIRSSLINIGRRLLNQNFTPQVSYFLLDAAVKVTKEKIVSLENPIGGMCNIAMKFGFNKDFEFKVQEDARKVEVQPYELVSLIN